MPFERKRNVTALALANLKEQCQQVREGAGLQSNHTRQHRCPSSHGQGGKRRGETRRDERKEGEGVEPTDSEFVITGA